MNIDVDALNALGWCVIPFQGNILEIAKTLGVPVANRINGSLVDRLQVLSWKDAHPNSLSSRYGTGAFPYHTDGAHHKEVPRLLLMRLASGCSTKRPTLVKDILSIATPEEKEVLENELWIFSSGQHAYLSPIYKRDSERNDILRFDRDCMKPALSSRNRGLTIVDMLLDRTKTINIVWEQDVLLILNNRRLLHARASGTENDDDRSRILERVLVL